MPMRQRKDENRCRRCNEYIPHPSEDRPLCHECSGEKRALMEESRSRARGGNASDRQYHGGMFYAGEW